MKSFWLKIFFLINWMMLIAGDWFSDRHDPVLHRKLGCGPGDSILLWMEVGAGCSGRSPYTDVV